MVRTVQVNRPYLANGRRVNFANPLTSIYHSFLKTGVSIDAPVTQEWPMGAMFVHPIPFHVGEDNFFSIHRTFGNDFATRRRNKTLAPELDSIATLGRFMSDAIRRRDVTSVRNGMAALNCFPGRILSRAEFPFFRWMPADGGWIK